jgi:acyl-coenzyme A thioesterase PaaI-like protein
MDFEAVRAGLEQAIPFNVHVGLSVREVERGRGVVTLPDRDELRNHVGSQHAGALFSAGEAASGAAFVGSFAERMGDLTPLAESADIAYKKIARGEITATGTLGEDASSLLEQLDKDGRIRFPISVEMTDADGTVVAEMTVQWYVKTKSAA